MRSGIFLGYVLSGVMIWSVSHSIGEMAVMYPLPSAFVQWSGKFVDPAAAFAVGKCSSFSPCFHLVFTSFSPLLDLFFTLFPICIVFVDEIGPLGWAYWVSDPVQMIREKRQSPHFPVLF